MKKSMKKLSAALLAVAMVLTLVACGSGEEQVPAAESAAEGEVPKRHSPPKRLKGRRLPQMRS